MRVLLFIFIMLGGFTSKADSGCEAEVNPKLRAFDRYTDRLLREGHLGPDDLKMMIEDEGLPNPYHEQCRSDENFSLCQGMDRAIRAIGTNIEPAKEILRKILAKHLGLQEKVAEAREITRSYIDPGHVMTLLEHEPATNRGAKREVIWHTREDGRLQLVVFDRSEFQLRVFSPYHKRPVLNRILATGMRNDGRIKERASILSSRRGQLYVAVFGEKNGQDYLIVHNMNTDQTLELEIPSHVQFLKLYHSPSGAVQLLVVMPTEIKIFNVGTELVQAHRLEKTFDLGSNFHFVEGALGHNSYLLVTDNKTAMVVELPSGKVRKHSFEKYILGASIVSTLNGDYAISLRFLNQFCFLTSSAEEPLWTNISDQVIHSPELISTKDGRVLFAAGLSGVNSGAINIYEPLTANRPQKSIVKRMLNKLFPRRSETTIQPTKTFALNASNWMQTRSIELPSGHYLVVISSLDNRNDDDPRIFPVRLLSLDTGQMVYEQIFNGLQPDHYLIAEAQGRPYYVAHSPFVTIDLFTNTSPPRIPGGHAKFLTNLARDRNGDVLVATQGFSVFGNAPIDILRIKRQD